MNTTHSLQPDTESAPKLKTLKKVSLSFDPVRYAADSCFNLLRQFSPVCAEKSYRAQGYMRRRMYMFFTSVKPEMAFASAAWIIQRTYPYLQEKPEVDLPKWIASQTNFSTTPEPKIDAAFADILAVASSVELKNIFVNLLKQKPSRKHRI